MSRGFVIAMVAVTAIALSAFSYLLFQKTPRFSDVAIIYNDLPTPPSESEPNKTLSEFELKSNEQVKKLISQTNTVLEKIAQVCDNFHLEFAGAKEFIPTQGSISRSGAWLKSPVAEFYFWLPSQQITSWSNDSLELSLLTEVKKSDQRSPSYQPWTQDKAFEIGAAFLHVMLNGADVRLSQDVASFVPQQSKNGSGQWLLKWKRVDSHGYRFHNIEYKIQLPEGYCPVSAQIPEIPPYAEKNGTPIRQTEAFSIAHKAYPNSADADWTVTKDDSEVPVHIESAPEIIQDRLVWMFYYTPPRYHAYAVFIDAYTGESLLTFTP